MKKYNKETLMMCAAGNDKELSDYAKRLLKEMQYEIPDSSMPVKRIPDIIIMELYNSMDELLVRKSKELAITYHVNHIYYIIHRYFYQFEKFYSDDMFQCGAIGILKSLEHYDGSTSLTTYSRLYIIHEISQFTYFIRNIPSAHYARLQKQISDAIQEESLLTDEEIAERTGLRMKNVRKERQIMERTRFVYMDSEEKRDMLADPDDLEESVTDKIVAEQIMDFINKMPEKKRHVMKMHLLEEMSYRKIAARLGVSVPSALNWYHSCIDIIRKNFI